MGTFTDSILSLFFLVLMEIILGMDNLIFLAILTERLPSMLRQTVRSLGLMGAWILRLFLLCSALFIITQTSRPLFYLFSLSFSMRELFFIFGGFFLVYKSIVEISTELDFLEKHPPKKPFRSDKLGLSSLVIQVMLMDLVFSLDSVLTAIAFTKLYSIMALAITISIGAMYIASDFVSGFIHKHPSIKMLALAFLVMIGMFLLADGFHYEISRNYLYFSMFFSFTVESLNILYRHRQASKK